jgi:universal stress protein A
MSTVKKILVPTDFSEPAYAATRFAASLAHDLSSELVLLHVIDPKTGYSIPPGFSLYLPKATEIRRYVERELEGLAEEMKKLSRVSSVIVKGRAPIEILKLASSRQVDLVVMGARGQGALASALFGSTVSRVLSRATCPVLVHYERGVARDLPFGRQKRRVHSTVGARV